MLRWDQVRQELDAKPWEEIDGDLHRRVFIGTAKHIRASGKEYYLFDTDEAACRVCQKQLKPCSAARPCVPNLDGTSLHCDFCLDMQSSDKLIKEAAKRKLYVTCGDDDWRDIYVGEQKPIQPTKKLRRANRLV